MARESDALLETIAGPEIGVASTKAFTAQLTVMAVFALAMARARGTLPEAEIARLCSTLLEIPAKAAEILDDDGPIRRLAARIAEARDVLYLGRGGCFPIALEGALKLKEISYIHAEGYAAGEMKHGPIALIDKAVPVIAICPSGPLFEKTASNLQEAAARGGQIVVFSDAGRGGKTAKHRRGDDHAARDRPLRRADPLCHPGADAGLSCRRAERHGCRPATQPRQIRHRGVIFAVGSKVVPRLSEADTSRPGADPLSFANPLFILLNPVGADSVRFGARNLL